MTKCENHFTVGTMKLIVIVIKHILIFWRLDPDLAGPYWLGDKGCWKGEGSNFCTAKMPYVELFNEIPSHGRGFYGCALISVFFSPSGTRQRNCLFCAHLYQNPTSIWPQQLPSRPGETCPWYTK